MKISERIQFVSGSVIAATAKRKIQLTVIALVMMMTGQAQTYTTKAAGNWSSPSTWANGAVPSRTIAAAMTVTIKHRVNADLSGDLSVAGKLNVEGDTLKFGAAFGKKIIVAATGQLTVKNGGLVQYMAAHSNDLELAGRFVVDNALVQVSKNFIASPGSRKFIRNATLTVGESYTVDGSATAASVDTLQNASLQVGAVVSGSIDLKKDASWKVANASITVSQGDFKIASGATISVLAGATGNFGFTRIMTSKDLDNAGAWDARIDAHCIGGNIKGSNMAAIDLTRVEDCSVGNGAAAPELAFSNPVLKSGTNNKEGAVYRFANVIAGVDAEVKLKKFSRNDIVMRTVDNSILGWAKAFQPEFGLDGLVQPNQNWYIDFEMTFYKAGTNQKQKLTKFDLTVLDVDGDGQSVREYATFENPSNVIYSTVSYLTSQSAGLLGKSVTCPMDNKLTTLNACVLCGGDGKGGLWNIDACTACESTGLIHAGCNHPYDGVNGSTLSGPVQNFTNIDTAATQVMAVYQYADKDRIAFRYGAKSGSSSSNGAGIRLNSLWFRQFSMAPPPQILASLPVKLSAFEATLQGKDVQLSWTGYEENFSHYIVQRSTDGKNYEDIAIVFGNNKTGSSSAYSYKDKNVVTASGMLYYRLLLLDKGQETSAKSSDVRVIRLKEAAGAQLTAYPNPVVDALRLTLPTAWQGKSVVIEVFSVNGNRLQNVLVGSASQTETLQMKTLPRGIYVVSATCNGEVAQQRIVKQ